MPFQHGLIDGLWIHTGTSYVDERGFFHEVFRLCELEAVVEHPIHFVQINHSRSKHGALRGLHAEAWDKLVYVPHGLVFTAVADIRPRSPTFAKVQTFVLGDTDRTSVYIPQGLAHGYCVLSDDADYVYQVTAYYDGTDTSAVAWDDPDLAVPWPIRCPVLSMRDRHNPTLRQLFPERVDARVLVGT